MNKDDLIAFENRIGKLYENGDLPFLFHLSGGNEDQLIELFKNIDEKDYVLSNHRSHYHALLHGISPEKLEKMIIDGRSMFVYDKDKNFFCSAIIGGTPGIAIGIAWALKRKGSKQKVWCFVGDGTEDNGHLFEAIRYAEGWDLPCIFVIENNNRSVEATNADRWGETSDYEWDSNKVIKYKYDITFPHARKPGIVDLSKTKPKSHDEYFPPHSYPEVEKITSEGSYKEAIFECMEDLGRKGYIFIGYNVIKGNAMGTLASVPDIQKIETPVAENLMVGLAIGMSFEGFRPVVYFERQDFMMVAMDAIVNHLDKIERISHGEFKVPVIIRAVVADGGPFYSGITHSQDFTKMFQAVLQMPIFTPETGSDVKTAFEYGSICNKPIMVVEYKSRY